MIDDENERNCVPASGVAPTAVMIWKKSTEFFADDESAAQFAYPQRRESFTHSASRASS